MKSCKVVLLIHIFVSSMHHIETVWLNIIFSCNHLRFWLKYLNTQRIFVLKKSVKSWEFALTSPFTFSRFFIKFYLQHTKFSQCNESNNINSPQLWFSGCLSQSPIFHHMFACNWKHWLQGWIVAQFSLINDPKAMYDYQYFIKLLPLALY